MATPAENLDTLINNLLADLAANPPRPSYSIRGQTVKDERLAQLEKLQAMRGAVQGPIIRESYGVP